MIVYDCIVVYVHLLCLGQVMSDANVDQVAKLGCSWTHRPQSHRWCRRLIPVTSCDSFQCRAFFPEVFLGSAALSPTSPWKWSKCCQRYGAKIRSGKTWCFQSLGTKFCDDGVDFFRFPVAWDRFVLICVRCHHARTLLCAFLHSALSGSAMMKSSAIMAVVTVCTAVVALVQDLWLRAAILFGLLSEGMGSRQGSFVRSFWKLTKRTRSRSSHMMHPSQRHHCKSPPSAASCTHLAHLVSVRNCPSLPNHPHIL